MNTVLSSPNAMVLLCLVTLGAAGVQVVQEVLSGTQSAILPLVPYPDAPRWVPVAMALAAVAVTICARIDYGKRARR